MEDTDTHTDIMKCHAYLTAGGPLAGLRCRGAAVPSVCPALSNCSYIILTPHGHIVGILVQGYTVLKVFSINPQVAFQKDLPISVTLAMPVF